MHYRYKIKRTKGDWVPAGLSESVLLRIDQISYFEERGAPSKGIEELGFFLNSTLGKVDYQGHNHPEDDASLFVIRFVGGAEIAVAGEESICLVHKCV